MLRQDMLKRTTLPSNRCLTALVQLLCFQLFAQHVGAAFIQFQNCLPASVTRSNPLRLQFTPYFFDARFDTNSPGHNLNITIYGNVSGQAVQGTLPPPSDPSWLDPNNTFGKLYNVSPVGNNYSTLTQKYDVLTYNAYEAPPSEFCESTINGSCPLPPSFNGSRYDPYSLSAFTVAENFNSSYSFATFATTIQILPGDNNAPDLACISANITPDLGKRVSGLLTFLPATVLICVAIATAAAAIWSPWGTSDPFKWTTNYGRDEDLLRLVTPGFGDCLQYIQFIFLTGALTLNYPGYYQPATSQVSWAALMFNESFVSHGPGYQSLLDGVYTTNGTYGMTRMSQLVGMTRDEDVWACMAVWLLVILLIAAVFCQAAFLFRWLYRQISHTEDEDLRRKNWPLTAGMMIRVTYNFFLLPIVALSLFQLVIAPRSVVSVVAVAAILLIFIILFSGWILYFIFKTKPRAHLFDDLPTVLIYGSLYNTYSDDAASFALIPALLTFMRGVAIGAVQPSGIASLVILAICEVVMILTLHAFRPFSSPTHMNIYHTFFAAARLSTVLLMVAFVPSLGVTEAPKGWIGYAILLLHAIVLIFGFFLNALQTVIEVVARLAGAGGDPQLGAQRGGLMSYGWRQLRKRQPEKGRGRPGSMTSDAAILANDSDAKSLQLGGRTRSLSASSRLMLGPRRVSAFDQYSQGGDYMLSPDLETPMSTGFPSTVQPSSSGSLNHKPMLGLSTDQSPADPYYRAPRQRRGTFDAYTPGARSRRSGTGGEMDKPFEDWPISSPQDDAGEGPAEPPPFYQHGKPGSDPDLADGPRPDYAVRESDFYYGVTRGPALSNQAPARKRKTGPADPMGPASAASTWFQKIVGGKSKEKSKGFEVVRSSRAPPPVVRQMPRNEEEGQELTTSPQMNYPPYRDSPTPAVAGAEQYGNLPVTERAKRRMPLDGPWDAEESDDEQEPDEEDQSEMHDEMGEPMPRTPTSPPVLAPIERHGSFNFGFPSRSSTRRSADRPMERNPTLPRKSSRRRSRDIGQDNAPMPRIPASFEAERPTSMGIVQQRMTGDDIRHSGIGQGSSAEIVDNERTTSMG
ncbi:hypothetical protein MBLNU457_3090t1 [Dothideomycetes sp. NU457]